MLSEILNNTAPKINLNFDDLSKSFNRVLILTTRDYKNNINDIGYEEMKYNIISLPLSSIKYTIIKDFLQIVDYEYLNEHFNIDKTFLTSVDQKELVLNLSCINEYKIKSFSMQINGVCTFDDYIVASLINNFMNILFDGKMIHNRIKMLNSLNETSYWSIVNNCFLDFTDEFEARCFKKDDNYIDDHNFTSEDDISIESNINHENNSVCKKMSIETFNNFIDEMKLLYDDKEFYYLVMNLLASKDLCHLIINNHDMLLKLINSRFYSKYYYVFKYLLSYAWLSLYIEQRNKKRCISKNDRFIFSIKTATLLPDTPFKNDITDSSYLPILICKKSCDLNKNAMGVLRCFNPKIKCGVTSLEKYIFRQQLFLTGKRNYNILENINWSNIVICGSIMAACLPEYNPLMLKFMSIDEIKNNSIKFNNFINEYYRDSDVNILCNLEKFEYIDKIHSLVDSLENNIRKNISSEEIGNNIVITLKSYKTVSIIVNSAYVETILVSKLESKGLTYADIVKNINTFSIKEVVYPLYCEYKLDKINKFLQDKNNYKFWTNEKYMPEFEIVSIDDIQIIFSKKSETKDSIFIINENLKYKLSSEFMARSINVFKSHSNEYFNTIGSYLPIIQAYYDGEINDVFLTSSCISACMTLINIDYKYSGDKDPSSVVNKYRCRGFSIILNTKEIRRYLEYNNNNEKWKNLYSLDGSEDKNNESLGFKDPYDKMFEISKELYDEKTNYLNNTITSCNPEIFIKERYTFIEQQQPMNLFKTLKCLRDYSSPKPLEHYIIEAAYNMINARPEC